METLTIYQLRNQAEQFHALLSQTPEVDRFCSSLDWVLPAHEAFIPDHPLLLMKSDNGFIPLARGFNPRIGRYLQPLEASWCLACPFVGPDPFALMEDFDEVLRARRAEWDLLYLSGIPVDSQIFLSIVKQFQRDYRIGIGHVTRRYIASLEGGFDGFMSRRSSKFRANLRRSARAADEAGITYETIVANDDAEATAIYDRILAIEEKSWKGKEGTGILDGGMNTFYRIMIPRLIRRGAFRSIVARKDGEDIAYVFGALFDDTYRGLQLSFDDQYRQLSLGNLMQRAMIVSLCDEGIQQYDLGSELEYKASWAEERLESVTVWVWKER